MFLHLFPVNWLHNANVSFLFRLSDSLHYDLENLRFQDVISMQWLFTKQSSALRASRIQLMQNQWPQSLSYVSNLILLDILDLVQSIKNAKLNEKNDLYVTRYLTILPESSVYCHLWTAVLKEPQAHRIKANRICENLIGQEFGRKHDWFLTNDDTHDLLSILNLCHNTAAVRK